jgi:hypothetical protein
MSTMMTLKADRSRRCDAVCYGAKYPRCSCICGGRAHGKGYVDAQAAIADALGDPDILKTVLMDPEDEDDGPIVLNSEGLAFIDGIKQVPRRTRPHKPPRLKLAPLKKRRALAAGQLLLFDPIPDGDPMKLTAATPS